MNTSTSAHIVFLCPGEKHPISRAMHLARMAEFYEGCRNCEFRNETGTLSEKMVKRLKEAWASGRESAGFHEEGFGGLSPNDLTSSMARQVAAAFGLWLQRLDRIGPHSDPLPKGERVYKVAVAGDGRACVPEFLAGTCEGLRWAACEAFDLGPATAAAVQFAIAHFQLDGGILLGNAGEKQQTICMKFWGVGPHRMLGKSSFQPMEEILHGSLDRPARTFGPQHRLQVETPYLAALAERFHGLRPLKFVVDATSRPWVAYLEKLLHPTACRIIPCRVLPQDFSGQIVADQAHFGVKVTNDGERCTFFDEKGCQIEGGQISNAFSAYEKKTEVVPPDALTKMAQFLQLLSRDDRPCSEVLDDAKRGK
jgi:phosphomannomutase